MKFIFEGKAVIEIEHTPGMASSKLLQTGFNLDCFGALDKSKYLDKDDLPTADGVKALSNVFVQGLVGNIHHAHSKGYWKDADHIRYIIAELECGFVQIAETGVATFGEIKGNQPAPDISQVVDLESAIAYFLPKFEGLETDEHFIKGEQSFVNFCHSQLSGGIGMKIRNELKLWDEDTRLHIYFKRVHKADHPDGMSALIIRGIYKVMKNK